MIKPASLWSIFKTCEDPVWLGNLCRALGGQKVDLDFGQKQMLNAIRMDSDWMDERIESQREKWRKRQRNHRGKFISSQSPSEDDDIFDERDIGDMSRVTESHPPSVPPSVHPSSNNISGGGNACARDKKSPSSPSAPHNNSKTTKTIPDPKSWEEVLSYLESINLIMFNPDAIMAIYSDLSENGWKNAKGTPISDWKRYFKMTVERVNANYARTA